MSTGMKRAWFATGSIVSALASMWSFLWIISAASLASGFCHDRGGFSLFADTLRCRQAHYAMILMGVFAVACVWLGWKALHAARGRGA